MGAIVEVESPSLRRQRMVDEWLDASAETKRVRTRDGLQERAKTALMVAPTWSEIDALNLEARQRLRTAGRLTGPDQAFTALRAKDWTRAQHKDHRSYQPGDVLVAHKSTKHFILGEELRVLRKEKRRLILAGSTGEISVSPRQSGLAWTACEERLNPIAAGDRLRLRAIAYVVTPDGQSRRLANGTTVTVQSVNSTGQLILADGSTLNSRQVAYGYALTSHASQGTTVDKVFIAGAASREGLYVAAPRGRESVRIFVSDREQFLDAQGLRSEARTSALEFTRHQTLPARFKPYLTRAWNYLQNMRNQISAYLTLHPEALLVPVPQIHTMPATPELRPLTHRIHEEADPRPRHHHGHHESTTLSVGTRMRL